MPDSLKKTYPDGHLNEHGAQASQGVDSMLLVKSHGLLRHALPIIGVLLLDLFEQWLELGHTTGHFDLPQG